jgi:hypothetical protein
VIPSAWAANRRWPARTFSAALRNLPLPVTAQARGDVLRAEIHAAAARLWRGPLPTTRDAMLAAINNARRDPDDPRYAYVVRDPHYAAGTGANLAEASYELGDFDSVARYAAEVLADQTPKAALKNR